MTQSMIMYCDRSELLNANDRLHWRVKSARTKDLRWKATVFARESMMSLKPVTTRQHVTITYGWTNPRRIRDAGNLQPTSKALVDGLTDAGLWPDDNDAWVIGPDNRFGEPSDRPGLVKITIELEPVKQVAARWQHDLANGGCVPKTGVRRSGGPQGDAMKIGSLPCQDLSHAGVPGRSPARLPVLVLDLRCETFVPGYDCKGSGRDITSPYGADGYCLPCRIRAALDGDQPTGEAEAGR